MTRIEKLFEKFQTNPASLKYLEIEKILIFLGCIKIESKGSHKKFKHTLLKKDIVIPVHNNDCKNFYKNAILKTIQNLLI